jgi:hypothetical protein
METNWQVSIKHNSAFDHNNKDFLLKERKYIVC